MKPLQISRTAFVAGVLLVAPAATPSSQITEYKLAVTSDPHTDFSKLKTYEWEMGWIGIERDAHRHFVEAIGHQLSALGITKGAPGKSDLTVAYYSRCRDNVNLDWGVLTSGNPQPPCSVGTLVVVICEAGTRREVFRATADAPIDLEPVALSAIIDDTVARMFAPYPTRHPSPSTSRP